MVLLKVRGLEMGVAQVLLRALKRLYRISNGILVYLIGLVCLLHPVCPISSIFINLVEAVVLRRATGLKFYNTELVILV